MATGKARFHIALVNEGVSLKKTFDAESATLGRMDSCDLEVKHPDVSRRHITISVRNNEMYVEDLASTNGTFVNKNRIPAHQPVVVRPKDEVRFGADGPAFFVEIEGASAVAPNNSMELDSPVGFNAKQQSSIHLEVAPPPPKAEPPKPVVKTTPYTDAQHEIERMLRDARNRVAQTLAAAEVDAEKRVEHIHQRAKDTEARAEKFYTDRLSDAVKRSEKVQEEAQSQSVKILQEARVKAQAIRDKAEEQAVVIRAEAEKRCGELLDMAEARAQEAKDKRLGEADDIIHAKEVEILKGVRETAEAERLTLEQSLKKLRKERDEALAEVNSLHQQETSIRETLRKEEKEAREKIQHDLLTTRETLRKEESTTREALRKLDSETRESLRNETESSNATLKRNQDALASVKEDLVKLKAESEKERVAITELKKQREPMEKEAQNTVVALNNVKTQLEHKTKELPAQLAQLKEQFEAGHQKLVKEEEERLIQLKQKSQAEVKKFESELYGDLQRRKENFSREVLMMVESFYNSDQSAWKKNLPALGAKITASIDGESFSPTTQAKATNVVPLPVKNKRKQELNRFLYGGMAAGFALMLTAQWLFNKINSNPLQRAVASAQEERQKDLEARKFNPPQTNEVRETYADTVLYTRNFSTIYLEPKYQEAWFKAASLYLLKTWRIDEDHSLQVESAAAALVKELQTRKEAIHPDFVQKGIDQMKEIEKDTLNRMKTMVGGEVRLESFKKFEKQYFEKYLSQVKQ